MSTSDLQQVEVGGEQGGILPPPKLRPPIRRDHIGLGGRQEEILRLALLELIELGEEMTKAQICQMLINHPKFQSEEQQGAISEFVVRNCSKDVQKEVNQAVESNSEKTEESPVEA